MNICGSFNVEPEARHREHLTAHLSVSQVGGLDLARVGLDAKEVTRDRGNIKRDPGNHFFLILQHQGRAHLLQNDVSARLEPGDMFVVDSTRECVFGYQGGYSLQLSVHLPREEMCHRFGRRIFGGLSIAGTDPLALAMKAVLAKLVATPTSAQTHTVEAFYSVFGALLTERALGNGRSINPDRQLVQQALGLIAENYRAPQFSTKDLADQVGVSLRRLQRAFQVVGETPHERLQRYRVEAAHQAIQMRDPSDRQQTITSLAFAAGFRELSTFYRAYRKYFGRAPGQSAPHPPCDAERKRF